MRSLSTHVRKGIPESSTSSAAVGPAVKTFDGVYIPEDVLRAAPFSPLDVSELFVNQATGLGKRASRVATQVIFGVSRQRLRRLLEE